MVENIYGRKTHPQLRQEKTAFFNSLGQPRRASSGASGLRTICETDDDSTLCNTVDTSLLSTQQTDGNYTHKPRAISLPLPTVYRDGSYLRINVPGSFNYDKVRKRRFSEPAVPLSAASMALPCGTLISGHVYESCTFPRTPRISVNEEIVHHERNFDMEKRRHSDPLLYNTDSNSKEEECSKFKNEQCVNLTMLSRNILDAKTPAGGQDVEIATSEKSPSTTGGVRRRKSSLVPIPFGLNKITNRKPNPTVKRRFSFPLNKYERNMTASLDDIELSFQSRQIDDDPPMEQFEAPFDFIDAKLNDISTSNEDFESPKSCEKIITQWMKFFG